MKPNILIVEDEPDYAQLLHDAIALIHGNNVDTHIISDADSFLQFISEAQPRFSGVILDICMPPGKELASVDTKGGTWTGAFLFERLGKWLHVFQPQGLKTLPVAIHTHILDEQLKYNLEQVLAIQWPRLKLKFFYKPIPPSVFIADFLSWTE